MSNNTMIKINSSFLEVFKNNLHWEKNKSNKYIEYRNKWFENPKNYVAGQAPIHIDVETSTFCNLRCPMCSCTIEREKGDKASYKQGLMNLDLYKKIIDDASEIGVYSVKLNWRGEPLLNPHIVDMVKYAKEKGIIDIMINTNAVLLDEKMSISLIEAGLDHIYISVDSIRKDIYEKYRVGAEYEVVLNNIIRFCQLNNEKGHTVETRVQKVLLNETEHEKDDYIEFFSKIVDIVAFEDYIPYGERNYGKTVSKEKDTKFACCQLWQRLIIEWDGSYAMCCDSQNRELVLGNANNQKIKEIWHGSLLKNIRKLHKDGKWNQVFACEKCYSPHM